MAREVTRFDHEKHVKEDGGYGELFLKVVLLSNTESTGFVRVCNECKLILGFVCDHNKNTWNEDGTKLTCDLCGQDGT